ncbi:hypothetical protein J7400_17935 [Shimia sp. R9_2]|uniref:phage late control D family protein n=1 Tax=Shimia sp. R9_2 TaxID=2821112 RepID=UPI001ADD42DE|nr:hypothetical protein [Shimia sp. R9_2]MBO9398557.1 hypothetical protein [Shimia sp. R9_2]
MSLLSPTYRLTLGDQRIDMGSEPRASTVTQIDVQRAMAPLVDRFELTLVKLGTRLPKRGDKAEIELGFAGSDTGLERVMTGEIEEVDAGPEHTRIVGFGAGALLSRSNENHSFRDKTAADIVSDLANASGVKVADTETSEIFPTYIADARLSAFQHMVTLSELTGFDLYCDTENALIFKGFGNGKTLFPLDYGEDVIAYQIESTLASAERVEAWGESPGAAQGADSWAWLTKDFEPRKGSAGTSGSLRVLEHAALRTGETAQRAASALLRRIENRRIRGQLTVLGNPAITLGDTIRLQSMPEPDLNATFQIRGVRHRITKATGFLTHLTFQALELSL